MLTPRYKSVILIQFKLRKAQVQGVTQGENYDKG